MVKLPATVYFNDYMTDFKTNLTQFINQVPNSNDISVELAVLAQIYQRTCFDFSPMLLVLRTDDDDYLNHNTILPSAHYDILVCDYYVLNPTQMKQRGMLELVQADNATPIDFDMYVKKDVIGLDILMEPEKYFVSPSVLLVLPDLMADDQREFMLGDYPALKTVEDIENQLLPLFSFDRLNEVKYQKVIHEKSFLFNFVFADFADRLAKMTYKQPLSFTVENRLQQQVNHINQEILRQSNQYTQQKSWSEWAKVFPLQTEE